MVSSPLAGSCTGRRASTGLRAVRGGGRRGRQFPRVAASSSSGGGEGGSVSSLLFSVQLLLFLFPSGAPGETWEEEEEGVAARERGGKAFFAGRAFERRAVSLHAFEYCRRIGYFEMAQNVLG